MRALERKFTHHQTYYKEYASVMKEYLDLGHMVPVSRSEINTSDHYYVPHHAIIKEDSVTTKFRVVFNASSKTTNGNSLNDTLHVGPPLQVNLTDLLLRWRQYKVAFVGDIEKMYRMITLHPEDSNFQRIIWRNAEYEEFQDYKIPVVLFGVSSAPYLAMRTLQQLAQDETHNYPKAATRLQADIYVDDLLTGSDSVPEAIADRTEIGKLLNAGGFKMRKWASNYEEVLDGIPKEDLASQINLSLNGDDRVKTLGVHWHFHDDTIRFKWMHNEEAILDCVSKRKVLSTISQLFDPLGWIAPVIIRGKILMQNLWLDNLSWDDSLPSHRQKEWRQYVTDLSTVHRLTIPRWIHMAPSVKEVQLHGFCDASEQAYAAAVYIRVLDTTDTVHIHLLTSKTRVAPVKAVSLPRLELCGAVLLSRLLNHVQRTMQISTIHAWTDSMVTLSWIRARPNEWKTFVANRVSEIHDLVGPNIWNHVLSSDNPADLASRGGTVSQTLLSALWWSGPPWLKLTNSEWPHSSPDAAICTSERRKLKVVCFHAHSSESIPTSEMLLDLLSRYSSARTLFHVVAYVRRFIQRCRNSDCKCPSITLHNEEVTQARNLLIQVEQRIHYSKEIAALCTHGQLKSSGLKTLNPFLDGQGVLRVGGRLHFADLPYEERHPIILAPQGTLTKLITLQAHHDTLHGTIILMMGYLRQQFWIPRARTVIKACIFHCVKCFRLRHHTQQQLMGSLPYHRIEVTRPFTNVGVDYAGPIAIRASKGRGHKSYKGYIALFVCFSTKAVHIEVVSDQTSEAFLAALRRFIARRGLCRRLYSDCGTNFVGANSQLMADKLKFERQLHRDLAPTLMNLNGIEWHFIPPASPHFGGLWEAGVKSLKHHLRRVIGTMTLTFEEMITVTAQVEACLNSRPLYPLSENPEDFSVLTPGHFLIGNSLLAPPEPDIRTDTVVGLRRWRLCQKLTQDLWRKWSGEYLHRLQQRPKWTQPQKNLQINDLVVIHDERLPPLQWSLGRVIKLHPGKDGITRVVTLKTEKTELVRPIAKIAKLPASYTQ